MRYALTTEGLYEVQPVVLHFVAVAADQDSSSPELRLARRPVGDRGNQTSHVGGYFRVILTAGQRSRMQPLNVGSGLHTSHLSHEMSDSISIV